MKQKVIYKGEELSNSFFSKSINTMIKKIDANGIKSRDVVICKADTPLGVYLNWITCCKLNLLPVFVPSGCSLENINVFKTSINFKAILDLQGLDLHLRVNSIKYDSDLLRNVEQHSVIHMTSATTGSPKFVLRTKKQLDEELRRYIAYLKIDKSDVVFPIVPLDHSFGFISGMLLSIKLGANLVLPDMLLPRSIIKLSNDYKATFMLGSPYLYKKMLEVSSDYNLNDELRYIIASGEPMIEGIQDRFKKRFNKKLIQQYGSTETGSLCIDLYGRDYNCVGKPIPGVKLKFITTNKFLKKCIYVDSPNTIGSYICGNSEKYLGNKLYMTKDVGELRSDGSVVLWGRIDDILIINGKKVDKYLVASVIEQIKGVTKAKVFLKKHNDVKELICEYVGSEDLNKAVFIEHCKKVLADYQIPKNFIRIDNKTTWKT